MRIHIIMASLFCVLMIIDRTTSWGGPFAELSDSSKTRIMGIDSVRAAIDSRTRWTTRRARRPRPIPGQVLGNKKASIIQKLSDRPSKATTPYGAGNSYGRLESSLPNRYAAAEYYPSEPGTTWAYRVHGSGISNVKVLSDVATVREIETGVAVNGQTGVSVCYTSDNDGIMIHRQLFPRVYIRGMNTVDVIVTFIPPIRLADGIVEVGQTAYSIGTAQFTLLPKGVVVDLEYTATYTLQDRREVAVSAGIFDALHFQGTLIIAGDREEESFYVSKGVGLVKDVVTRNGKKKIVELDSVNVQP